MMNKNFGSRAGKQLFCEDTGGSVSLSGPPCAPNRPRAPKGPLALNWPRAPKLPSAPWRQRAFKLPCALSGPTR